MFYSIDCVTFEEKKIMINKIILILGLICSFIAYTLDVNIETIYTKIFLILFCGYLVYTTFIKKD